MFIKIFSDWILYIPCLKVFLIFFKLSFFYDLHFLRYTLNIWTLSVAVFRHLVHIPNSLHFIDSDETFYCSSYNSHSICQVFMRNIRNVSSNVTSKVSGVLRYGLHNSLKIRAVIIVQICLTNDFKPIKIFVHIFTYSSFKPLIFYKFAKLTVAIQSCINFH